MSNHVVANEDKIPVSEIKKVKKILIIQLLRGNTRKEKHDD